MRVFIHEITRLMILKMKMKMKNRSHRYDINRPRSRHGHKYSKYKKCLSIIMLICINQQLRKIWSSIHEKVKQHWDWVEKKRRLWKKACSQMWTHSSYLLFYCNSQEKNRFWREVWLEKVTASWSEASSEPCETSKIELKAVTYFDKKLHHV